ncbi:DUF1588 domain-containing protein [Akkermansiaceae bacterium]|nr:DUF1588 domain-containing protein [Akkermansiaceae bacterium]
MASILTATSSTHRTNPVIRGKWVMEALLGDKIPEPPADIPDLNEDAGINSTMTLRQELEAHRNKEECRKCHELIDPIGFGLENFDAMGRFRTHETGGQKIDSSGELEGFKFSGIAELKSWLLAHKEEEFVRNITERMLSFALGRELQTFDEAAIQKITTALKENDNKLEILIEEIVLSYPFLNKNNTPDLE